MRQNPVQRGAEEMASLKAVLNSSPYDRGWDMAWAAPDAFADWLVKQGMPDAARLVIEEGLTSGALDLPKKVFEKWYSSDECDDAVTGLHSTDIPSWVAIRYRRDVGPHEWLVHGSHYPDDIVREGFLRGMEDPSRLALTTHEAESRLAQPGYAFAFLATQRFDPRSYTHGKGGHVLFQASPAILTHHYFDEQDQVIFWSTSSRNRFQVRIEDVDDEWTIWDSLVKGEPDLEGTGELEFTGTRDEVLKWADARVFERRRYGPVRTAGQREHRPRRSRP